MDALSRTRELLERGDPIETVVHDLRAKGFGLIESLSALIKAGVSYEDARSTVVDGSVWADHRHKVTTNRWVDPPERPDLKTVERLRTVCSQVPRIAEVWVTGSQMTRHDGSSDVTTGLAIVLDPPAADLRDEHERAATNEIMTKLDSAWSTTGRRSFLWVSREIVASKEQHCHAIYSRP